VLAGVFAGSLIIGALRCFTTVRPIGRALILYAVGPAFVLAWWLSLSPSNDRLWLPDVAELSSATIDGDQLTISNVRNFHYRSETDYDVHWETRTYDVADIKGLDLYLIYWGPTKIAHTILSWEFEDDAGDRKYLAISIETRKEAGESYSALLGFFRQYELYYVVADERDVIALRANYRGEEVYLYRLNRSPEDARAILLDYFEEINRLTKAPAWYNAVTHNCTTAARKHTMIVGGGGPWDWRFLLNGSLDELGYERGAIRSDLPFEELRAASNITERSKNAGLGTDYSDVIRQHID